MLNKIWYLHPTERRALEGADKCWRRPDIWIFRFGLYLNFCMTVRLFKKAWITHDPWDLKATVKYQTRPSGEMAVPIPTAWGPIMMKMVWRLEAGLPPDCEALALKGCKCSQLKYECSYFTLDSHTALITSHWTLRSTCRSLSGLLIARLELSWNRGNW